MRLERRHRRHRRLEPAARAFGPRRVGRTPASKARIAPLQTPVGVDDQVGTADADNAERGEDLRPRILDAFELANQNVLDLRIGAGTTLVVVEISDRVVRTYHAGDSIAVLVGQRGQLKIDTIPHSPVGYGVASGMLGEEESMVHEDRSLISNCVGSPDMHLDVGAPF